MKGSVTGVLVLSGLIALAVSMGGCSARRSYNRGISLLEQGRYDAAITHLTQAVDNRSGLLGPNEDYLAALARAKSEGAVWHRQQAREAVADTRLDAAAEHINTALKYNPSLAGASELRADIRRRTDAAYADRGAALALAEKGRWDEAVERMRHALSQFTTMPGGAADLDRLRRGAADMYLSRARRELAQDNRDAAEQQARTSLEYHENSGAREVLRVVADRHRADKLVSNADALFEAAQYAQALGHLQQARQLHPQREDIPPLIHRAKVAVCDELIARSDAYVAAGRWADALRALLESDSVLPGYAPAAERTARVERELARLHLAAADDVDLADRPAAALLHYLAAVAYGADHPSVHEAIAQSRGELDHRTRYTIALAGFDSPAREADLAGRFETRAMQTMLRAGPDNVTIVDGRHEAARDADATLSGQVLDSRIMQNQTSTYGTTEYQAGTKLVPNRAFDRAVADVNRAEDDVARALRRYEDAVAQLRRDNRRTGRNVSPRSSSRVRRYRRQLDSAQDALSRAKRNLRATPSHVARPRILRHRYPIYHVTVTAEVEASVRMRDAATGEVLMTTTVSGRSRASDRYVEGDPERNVRAEPLNLPDDATLRNRSAQQALAELDRAVTRAVAMHGRRFAILARQAASDGEADLAVENAVGYLFAYPAGAADSREMLDIAAEPLADEADLIPLAELLGDYCGIVIR